MGWRGEWRGGEGLGGEGRGGEGKGGENGMGGVWVGLVVCDSLDGVG